MNRITTETSLRGEKPYSRFTTTYYLKCTQNFSNYIKKQGSMINIQWGKRQSIQMVPDYHQVWNLTKT